ANITIGVWFGSGIIAIIQCLQIAYRAARDTGLADQLVRGPVAPVIHVLGDIRRRKPIEDQKPAGGIYQQQIVAPLITVDRAHSYLTQVRVRDVAQAATVGRGQDPGPTAGVHAEAGRAVPRVDYVLAPVVPT